MRSKQERSQGEGDRRNREREAGREEGETSGRCRGGVGLPGRPPPPPLFPPHNSPSHESLCLRQKPACAKPFHFREMPHARVFLAPFPERCSGGFHQHFKAQIWGVSSGQLRPLVLGDSSFELRKTLLIHGERAGRAGCVAFQAY